MIVFSNFPVGGTKRHKVLARSLLENLLDKGRKAFLNIQALFVFSISPKPYIIMGCVNFHIILLLRCLRQNCVSAHETLA